MKAWRARTLLTGMLALAAGPAAAQNTLPAIDTMSVGNVDAIALPLESGRRCPGTIPLLVVNRRAVPGLVGGSTTAVPTAPVASTVTKAARSATAGPFGNGKERPYGAASQVAASAEPAASVT